MQTLTTTTLSGITNGMPKTALPASTTAASAFNAARGLGNFGRYGFDGVSKPLADSAPMQSQAKRSTASSRVAKLYPSDFMPKSLAGKVLLAPLGLLMLAGSAITALLALAELRPMTQDELRQQASLDLTNPLSTEFDN